MRDNIRQFYLDNCGKYTEASILWYPRMNYYLKKFKGDLLKNCALFSVMSINTSLTLNIKKFEHYKSTGEFTGLYKNKIIAIENCIGNQDCILEILNGPKISNFTMNIFNPLDNNWVTIDRHSARIAGITSKSLSKKQYYKVADAYKSVAKEFYLPTHSIQAMTWVIKANY